MVSTRMADPDDGAKIHGITDGGTRSNRSVLRSVSFMKEGKSTGTGCSCRFPDSSVAML